MKRAFLKIIPILLVVSFIVYAVNNHRAYKAQIEAEKTQKDGIEKNVTSEVDTMENSDWVLIGATLFLGVIALIGPYLAEITKRKCFAPNLKVLFEPKPPDCHKTKYRDNEPVYYFRFRVTNTGKSRAKKCEAVIEKLYKSDAAGSYHQIKFSPINLIWGSSFGEYVDINPKRTFYCDLFLIPSKKNQSERQLKNEVVNLEDTPPFDLGFILSLKAVFFSQPNRLPPGEYKITVGVFSENSPKTTQTFKVVWSGKWKDTEDAMFKEAVLCLI